MSEIKRHLPEEYKPLEAKDFGRTVSEDDPEQQRNLDLAYAQEFVDYHNRLEIVDIQTQPIPEILSVQDTQLAERVKRDYDTYGMVIVSSEMNKEITGVREELNREQIELEVSEMEASRLSILEAHKRGIITDKERDEEMRNLDNDIADVKSGKDLRPTYSVLEVVQELPGQPAKKIKIYADSNRWKIQTIVPRGYNKSGRGVISDVNTEKQKQLPLEGVIWNPFDYAKREADSRIQPAMVVSLYQEKPRY